MASIISSSPEVPSMFTFGAAQDQAQDAHLSPSPSPYWEQTSETPHLSRRARRRHRHRRPRLSLDDIFRLDAETIDYLCSHLAPQDLALLSCCSITINTEVAAYYRRAMGIERLLRPFFDDPDSFRALQATTGTLVSGSTALQLFARETYPNADLDIYVELRYAEDVVRFLVQNNYEFYPRGPQDEDPLVAVVNTSVNMGNSAARYLGRGIADVLDFKRGDKKIQLIAAKKAPLDIILSYHSTCVMNVITHQRAYSLFPRATFIDRQALVITTSGSAQEAAREKYVERGWSMLDTGYEGVAIQHSSDFHSSSRWIGDRSTWTIDLSPPLPDLGEDTISANTFALAYDYYSGPIISYDFVHHPRLRHIYTVVEKAQSLFRAFLKTQTARSRHDNKCLDHHLNESMCMMREVIFRSDDRYSYFDYPTFTRGRHLEYFEEDLERW